MNIRGTDATALASVTDLFVAVTPRDDADLDSFQRALQPPQRPAHENAQSSARRDEEKDSKHQQPVPCRAPTPAAEPRNESPPEPHRETKEPSSEEPLAPAAEHADSEADEEPTTEEDTAAESFAAAANLTGEQKIVEPPVQQTDPAVVISELHSSKVEGKVVAEAVEKSASAPQPAVEVTLATAAEQPLLAKTDAAASEAAIGEIPPIDPLEGQLPTAAVEPGTSVLPSAHQQTGETELNSQPNVAGSAEVNGEAAEGKRKASARSIDADASAEEAIALSPATESAEESSSREDLTGFEKGSPQQALEPKEQLAPNPSATQTITNMPSTTAVTNDAAPAVAPVSSTDLPAVSATERASGTATQQPLQAAAIIQRLPAHALVRNTSAQPAEAAPLHVDSARFLQRVARAFEAARERDGEIRLRLSPPELGALRVEVQMHEQGLIAKLEVETNEARNILLENLPALRERLAEQGLRLERFDVDLSQREPNERGGELPDQPQDRRPHSETRQAKNAALGQPTVAASQPIPTPTTGWQDRQLNVIV